MPKAPRVPEVDPRLHDFRNFLYLIWKHLGLPPPTPVQYLIADYLQSGPRKKVIAAFRGCGKSWITSALVCWKLLLDPQEKFLIVSASKNRADDWTTFTKRIITEVPMLQHLKPRADQRDSRVSFDVGPASAAHAPSVKSLGITSQLSGNRAHEVIADDVEVPNNSATETMREKLAEAITEFQDIVMPDIGRITYLGTPQSVESIYSDLENKGFDMRIWPARYPYKDKLTSYNGNLCPALQDALDAPVLDSEGRLVGELPHGLQLDPEVSQGHLREHGLQGCPTDTRFGELELQEKYLGKGRLGWELQYMLNTRLSDEARFPLKLQDLVVMDLDLDVGPAKVVRSRDPRNAWDDLPNPGFAGDRFYKPVEVVGGYRPYDGKALHIDPSGRGKDETAWCVTAMLSGQICLLGAGGFHSGYGPETLEALALIAKTYGVNLIQIEANFGDGMFSELLKPYLRRIYEVTTEEVKHSTQKEARMIDTLEPVMAQGRLLVSREVVQKDERVDSALGPEECLKYQLFRQLTHVTRDRGCLRHDDRLDVLSMAVGYWIDHMATTADEGIRRQAEESMNEALRDFESSYWGSWGRQQPSKVGGWR